MDYGAFVEVLPGKEGLVHISRLSRQRVAQVTDVFKEGDNIPVKIVEIDKMGRISLSYIDAIDPDGAVESPPREDRDYSRRDNRDGGRHNSRDNCRRDDRPRRY